MMMARLAPMAVVTGWLMMLGAGCDDSNSTAPGDGVSKARSAALALSADGAELWLTSPDDDQVVVLNPSSLEVIRTFDVPGEPARIALTATEAVITRSRHAEVAVLDRSRGAIRTLPTPCGGTEALVLDDEGGALVACPFDDLVLRLDLSLGQVSHRWPIHGRPTGLARAGHLVWITTAREGAQHRLDLRTGDLSTQPLDPGAPVGHAASQARALALVDAEPIALFQRVDHDSDRDRPPAQGGYGSVFDDAPRIEPRLSGPCGATYARFDGGLRVHSGPVDLAWADGHLWIAHQYTDTVVVLRCDPEAPANGLMPLEAIFRVGRGPRGLTLSADGRAAWIDVGFDHAVARLELPTEPVDDRVLEPAVERRRTPGPAMRFSKVAQRGRALFHDATNIRLTPSGVVTCATCHPDGADDGLAWFLHTEAVPRKLRRTPPVYNTAPDLSPFHWDGEFPDAAELTLGTIQALMEGNGLLVDVEAVATWMAELEPPPGRPWSGAELAAAERGQALFERPTAEGGCAECHPAPLYTDNRPHAVLPPSEDADARLSEVITPSLRGIRTRPPFFHDGRAPDLASTLQVEAHGAGLSAEERADLVLYLSTL